MSGLPAKLPPPSNPALLPVLAAATFLAALVATWGVLSLALDVDVIGYSDAGPLLGPAMAVVASVATWAWVVRTIRVTWVVRGALVAAAVAYSAVVLTGAIGYGLARASIGWMPVAAGHFALSPFVVAVAPLAALTVIVAWALARAAENRSRERSRHLTAESDETTLGEVCAQARSQWVCPSDDPHGIPAHSLAGPVELD